MQTLICGLALESNKGVSTELQYAISSELIKLKGVKSNQAVSQRGTVVKSCNTKGCMHWNHKVVVFYMLVKKDSSCESL